MYRLYIEYALNILRHKPGYTLKRAVAFFGKYYREFKEIFDQIAGIYEDQEQIKRARDVYNFARVMEHLSVTLKRLDEKINYAIKHAKWTPTSSGGGLAHANAHLGDEYGDKLITIYAHKSKGKIKPDTTRGIALKEPRTIVNKKTGASRRIWDLVTLEGLEKWNKNPRYHKIYKKTPEAVKTIAHYLNAKEEKKAAEASISEYWTGYVFLELLNL